MVKKKATSTQRSRDLRKRRETEGLTEVRGIWLKPVFHTQAKAYCRALGVLRKKKKKVDPLLD